MLNNWIRNARIGNAPLAEVALLVVLVAAIVIPFSDRAVFSDEPLYLKLARSALTNPLFPADTPALFFGIEWPNFIGHTHPPVGEYVVAGIYLLFGEFREVPFRLTYAGFALMAVLSFYSLARRFCTDPFFVAVLFAVSPVFFVMAPTLMMDIPIIAFLMTGMAFYFRALLWPAALCFTLAVGAGYAALVPLTCLAGIMVLSRRPKRELLCVAAAPIALGLWLIAMTIHFGTFPLKETATYLTLQGIAPKGAMQLITSRISSVTANTLATLTCLGGVLVFPGMVRLTKRNSWLAAIGLATFLSFLAPAGAIPTFLYRLWFVFLATCGIMMLTAFWGSASRTMRSGANVGEPILILWAPAALVFFILVGEIFAARYLLLAMPALYLVIFRNSSRSDLTATAVPTFALALVLAYADASFVDSYRTWVRTRVPELQQQGFRVYSASESGLRFYLESAGAATLKANEVRPAGTDLIVRHAMYGYSLGADAEVVLTELKRFPLEGSFPVRTFSPASRAGFWDNHFGLTPFVLSSVPYDEVIVTQVNPLVAELPQRSTDPNEVPVYSANGPMFKQAPGVRLAPVKVQQNVTIEYELAGGEGSAELTAEGLRLTNQGPSTVEWRRLRVAPRQWKNLP